MHRRCYVCFNCRKSFKKRYWGSSTYKCSDCGQELTHAGNAFAAPKKSNKKQWELVEKRIREKGPFYGGQKRTYSGCSYYRGNRDWSKKNKLKPYIWKNKD